MICDECTKKTVCKYKEDCNKFEEAATNVSQTEECNFSVTVKCKHKEVAGPAKSPPFIPGIRTKIIDPYNSPTSIRYDETHSRCRSAADY